MMMINSLCNILLIIAFILLIKIFFITVEGGHRAIIFNRIGGVGRDIYTEGLHFRVPWFQYPVIYDIRYVMIIHVELIYLFKKNKYINN